MRLKVVGSAIVSVSIVDRCCHSVWEATTRTLPGSPSPGLRVGSGYYPIGPRRECCDPLGMESTQLPPEPQTQRPRLERLRSDRAVAGVASGLARYLDVDVAWIRIAFVVAALFGGTGVLMYLVGWIAMPEEGTKESIVSEKTRTNENVVSWIGIGLIALALFIVIENTGLIDGDLIFAGVLIVLGFLLYRGDLGSFGRSEASEQEEVSVGASSLSPSVEPAPSPIVGESTDLYSTVESAVPETPLPPVPPAPVSPPPPPDPAFQPREPRAPRPRESSALGRLALATILIAVGVMGVGQSSGWWEPTVRHYVGTVFVVLGAALVVGSVFGRARWLIAVGLISAPLLFGAALLDVPLEGGFGDPLFEPRATTELEDEYRLVGGELELDLTELELAEGEVYQVDASVVFGSLQIRVPEGMGISVEAEIDAGEIRFDGNPVAQGVNHDRSLAYAGTGLIEIDAHVGFGELVVDQLEVTP